MLRSERFELNKNHPMIGNLYKKIRPEDHQFCLNFLKDTEELNDDDFSAKINRLWMDDPNRPRTSGEMWAILMACKETRVRRRGVYV